MQELRGKARRALTARAPPRNALRLLTRPPRRRPRCKPGSRDGGRVREDVAAVRAGGLRLRSARGLAGKPAAAALPGLEKEEAARQAGGDAEEAGPGLRSPRCRSPPATARPRRGHLASPARGSSRSQARHTLSARSAGLLPESVSSTYSDALWGDFGDGRISWDRRVFGEPTGGDLSPQAPERGGSSVFPNNSHFGIVVHCVCLTGLS